MSSANDLTDGGYGAWDAFKSSLHDGCAGQLATGLIDSLTWSDVGGIATALAVLIAAWQVRQNNALHRADYEDAFDRQYRDLAMIIPMDAFLGSRDVLEPEAREAIYNYFDLCNEQIYQHSKGRITKDTWRDWSSGISSNMNRPAFQLVWREVTTQAPGTFTYLERFVSTDKKIRK